MSSTVPVFSKNLNGSTELTLIANLRQGFVPLPDPMSYATRLDQMLTELFETRKGVIEQGPQFLGPLERLRTISFVRWALLDGGKRLLLAVTFDRPWEPYIRRIVEEAGPLLDVIFSHCEGYDGHACRDGYATFAEWVHARQLECEFFFAAFPGQTVDDLHILAKLKSSLERFTVGSSSATDRPSGAPASTLESLPLDAQLTSLTVGTPGVAEYAAFFRSAVGLYRLRSLFPANPVPDLNYSDRAIFDRACASLLSCFSNQPPNAVAASVPRFPPLLAAQYEGLSAWYGSLFGVPAAPALKDTLPTSDAQHGILESLVDGKKPMTHGCAVLLQFGDNAPRFLEAMRNRCMRPEAGVHYNIGFTFQGLQKLGLSEQELSVFPPEFQQGMAARAGLLGDVSSNHPETWRLPRVNMDEKPTLELQLSDVDAVVLLQTRATPAEGDHLWSAQHPLAGNVEHLRTLGARPLHVQPLRRHDVPGTDKFREHFGFLDGFGQPTVVSTNPGLNDVMPGEVLLGHPNDNGEVFGDKNPILNNGSFLILRKISQRVAAFNQLVGSAAAPMATKMVGRTPAGVPATDPTFKTNAVFDYSADTFGAQCPLQSHVRLANPRTPETQSVFGRRMRVPRILRRGFSYGSRFTAETENEERGLLFMAYNASIAQQYEVIQRWLNGANGTGLDSSQRDPLSGAVSVNGGKVFRYRDGETVKTVPLPDEPLAKLEWGMYVFSPSFEGLACLARASRQAQERVAAQAGCPCKVTPDQQALLGRGQKILSELLKSSKGSDWRSVLEEQGAAQESFEALAAIRANHRVLRTPLGVLVAGAPEALELLTHEESFSVREYYRRMIAAEMPMHLGMDAKPLPRAVCPMRGVSGTPADAQYVADVGNGAVNYQRESIANGFIHDITRLKAFLRAYEITRELLDGSIGVELDTAEQVVALAAASGGAVPDSKSRPLRVTVDLTVFGQRAISELSRLWFGIPDGAKMLLNGEPANALDPQAFCPVDFTIFSLYVFRPDPDKATAALAAARGPRVSAAAKEFVTEQLAAGTAKHPFVQYLTGETARLGLTGTDAAQLMTRSLVGTVDGFVAACYGSFISVIEQWLEAGELFRTQQAFARGLSEAQLQSLADRAEGTPPSHPDELADTAPFVAKMVEALKIFPKPPWLHRVAVEDTVIGSVQVKSGEQVSVHLGQAALEEPTDAALLFGGPYGQYDAASKTRRIDDERTPLHACPAREMAMGVLLGMVVGVLKRNNLRMEGRFALSFEASPADIARVSAKSAPA
jgi:Dyp-type peroxidase family